MHINPIQFTKAMRARLVSDLPSEWLEQLEVKLEKQLGHVKHSDCSRC
jgi:hypothetical protein